MKKLALFLLMAVFTLTPLTLAACGNGPVADAPEPAAPPPQEAAGAASSDPAPAEPEPDDDTAPPEDDEPEGVPDFALRVSDFLIEMDQDFEYVRAALGEPLAEFSRPSCAFDGEDIVFDYPNIEISTYPVGDAHHVHTIVFKNDLVRTTEGGIRLHSSLQAVLDAYGDDYEHDSGMYTFTRGLTTLEFFVEDDMVTEIAYGFIIE